MAAETSVGLAPEKFATAVACEEGSDCVKMEDVLICGVRQHVHPCFQC